MFGRVRGKWIIQAAVQLCQFRISFNGGKTSWGNFFNCPTLLCFVISQDELYEGGDLDRERISKTLECGFQFGLLAMLWMAEWEFLIEFFLTFYEVSRNGRENNEHSIENSGNSTESSVDWKVSQPTHFKLCSFSQPPSPPLFMLARSVNREFKLNYERVRQTCSSTWVIYWLRIKNKLGFSAVLIILIKSITQPRLIH